MKPEPQRRRLLEANPAQHLDIAREILVRGLTELTIRHIAYRVDEVDAIEQVKNFAANLETALLTQEGQPEKSLSREIHVCQAGPVISISTQIAFGAQCRDGKVTDFEHALEEVGATRTDVAAEAWNVGHVVVVAVRVEVS